MSLDLLQEKIREAASRATPLRLRGGGSKDFYGLNLHGEILDTRGHAGIVEYDPSELVVTVRGGTPLAELENLLREHGQCLPFEPPHFGPATVGGCIATGLSGPRRLSAGAVRDYVLGASIVDGQGRLLRFGGKVMKNVAGYDVSRLVCGSMGTLGLIAEVSLKLLPLPPAEHSLSLSMSEAEAIARLNEWGGQPLPITASVWCDGALRLRLAGAVAAVEAATRNLGGERMGTEEAARFWAGVREQQHAFFNGDAPLWRLALPSVTPALDMDTRPLIEWGGGLRWYRGSRDMHALAARSGGHATLFRGQPKSACFAPLPAVLLRIQRELKRSFDPAGILNPGRLHAEF